MILNPIILEDIEHTQKANESHVRAFDSIIDKVYREDKERKEKAENARKKKEAILHKQEPEKRKAEEAEQRATAEGVSSGTNENIQEAASNDATYQANESIQTELSSTWSEVTPEVAANYMEEGTGVSASVWAGVIYRESSNNPYALNSLGCFGYLQIMQSVHGNVSSWSPQAYLDKAIEIYHSQGAQAWEAW